jgi:hypothetical protein
VDASAPSTYDPELDPPRPRHRIEGVLPPTQLPQQYQRLVTNPFLALSGAVFLLVVLEYVPGVPRLSVAFAAVVACLADVALLLQYHCLDCGKTGLLVRWKLHACDRVRHRRRTGQIRHIRGPNPSYQLFLWGFALVVLGILIVPVLLADLP